MKTVYALPILTVLHLYTVAAFTSFSNHVVTSSTRLHLEDHIANMIDGELSRLSNKQEIDKQGKNNRIIEPALPTGFDYSDYASLNSDENVVQSRRDKRMARMNPEKYCADRCISTGYCDVYEDMLEMSAEDVIQFCEECVLSDNEEPCNIPEKMLEGDYPEFALRP